jgi:mannose-6-phosphate isomerase-like protein (cupin superfamily)
LGLGDTDKARGKQAFMRLIVTGVNSAGHSSILSVEEVSTLERGRHSVWESDPVLTTRWVDDIDAQTVPPGIEPAAGASRMIMGKGSGDGSPKRGFHVTRTIDYYYLLSGRVRLELDEGEVEVEAGDLVIQQAARHRWVPYDGVDFRYLVVLHRL